MNIHELEARHDDGYANEHHRQFAHECATRERRGESLVAALNAGKVCVVGAGPDYCPHTDAIMGEREYLCSAHGNVAEAENALRELEAELSESDEDRFFVLH